MLKNLPRGCIICILLLLNVPLIAQQGIGSPEALLAEAANEKQDTNKLKKLIAVAAQLLETGKRDQFLEVAHRCRVILKETPFVPAQVDLYRLLTEFNMATGNSTLRHLYADSMLMISRKENYPHGEAKGLLAKALALTLEMKMDEALDHIKRAIVLFEKAGDTRGLAKCYKINGNLLLQAGDGLGAVAQYQLAAAMYKNVGAVNDEALIYANAARAFKTKDKLDSAILYNQKAMVLAKQVPSGSQLHFMVQMSDAEFQSAKGNYDAAYQSIAKAQMIAEAQQNNSMLGAVYVIKTNIAIDQKDYATALKYTLLSYELRKKTGNVSLLLQSYLELSQVYAKSGDYKNAYLYRDLYGKVNDSLFSQQSVTEIRELNVKFKTAEKEKQIAEQQLAIAKKDIRLRNLLFILLGATLVIGILLLLFAQRRRNYQQSLIALKKEQDISLLKALMTGEEKERNRLARELHDGLGGILAAAQMQVSNLDAFNHQGNEVKKEQAAGLIGKAAAETRRIAHNLLPETLIRYGLDEALREYSQSITDSKLLRLDYESVGTAVSLNEAAALSIYRIIQELVNNIVKHAGATEALVQLHQSGNKIAITVEDNGKGFAPGVQDKTGIGLSNIKNRVSYLKGSLDIRSEAQKGTSVYIEIQLTKDDGKN